MGEFVDLENWRGSLTPAELAVFGGPPRDSDGRPLSEEVRAWPTFFDQCEDGCLGGGVVEVLADLRAGRWEARPKPETEKKP